MVKKVEIRINGARSIEHAMDKAIQKAEDMALLEGEEDAGIVVEKVVFKSLEVDVAYRGNEWTYIFEAELG